MATYGRRAQRRRTKELVLGTVALLAIVVVVASVSYYNLSRPPALSAATMCPASGPTGHYVLLVDKTDPFKFIQRQDFDVVLQGLLARRIPEGYLLSVFALDEDFKTTAEPLIEACNPGTGADKSEFDANPKKLQEQFDDRFLGPVSKVAVALVGSKPAATSPIFEMLQLVSINGFRKHAVKGERRLIIVSDMLHNTPELSMYKGAVEYTSFASTGYAKRLNLDLPNVAVEIHLLMNSPILQTKRLTKFWEDYFEKAGARVVSVRPMAG